MVKNMKRITQVVLAIAALALMAADSAKQAAKPIPPDDTADVQLIARSFGERSKVDKHGNVVKIEFYGADLERDAAVEPALRRLHHVTDAQVTGSPFHSPYQLVDSIVKEWTELESLDLSWMPGDDTLADLKRLRKLKSLAVHDARAVSDDGVRSIARHKDLETLILSTGGGARSKFTDACMRDIAGLQKLKRLYLDGARITDEGLKQLKVNKLEDLSLKATRVTDRGIDEIKHMTSLRYLDLRDTKVTKAALMKLKGIPELKVFGLPRGELHEVKDDSADVAAIEAAGIQVAKSNVSDNVDVVYGDVDDVKPSAWTSHLKGLHGLEELRLFHAADADLQFVAGMKSLVTLYLSGDFSDDGLKPLGTLTSLKVLYCGGARITSAGEKYLAP